MSTWKNEQSKINECSRQWLWTHNIYMHMHTRTHARTHAHTKAKPTAAMLT